jgi:hypothetical protein
MNDASFLWRWRRPWPRRALTDIQGWTLASTFVVTIVVVYVTSL